MYCTYSPVTISIDDLYLSLDFSVDIASKINYIIIGNNGAQHDFYEFLYHIFSGNWQLNITKF